MLRRQICPPTVGLSSIKTTSRADSAAVTAAAIPAGPPPMTATSTLVDEALLIAANLHSFATRNLAAALVRVSVDGDAAFETRPHAAERRTLFAGDRDPARVMRVQDCRGHACTDRYANRLPIYAHGNHARCCRVARHAFPPGYV